jgi:hypothetical protein
LTARARVATSVETRRRRANLNKRDCSIVEERADRSQLPL